MRARKNNIVKLKISKIRAGKLAARGEFVPSDGSTFDFEKNHLGPAQAGTVENHRHRSI
ncbi:MAG TPA: hypothetical protein VHU83_14460 [Bryobacteraceae bacterium]|nr:hypothetical protein [Bryobacteraceae bacterium]